MMIMNLVSRAKKKSITGDQVLRELVRMQLE